jgi:hypothetical protein
MEKLRIFYQMELEFIKKIKKFYVVNFPKESYKAWELFSIMINWLIKESLIKGSFLDKVCIIKIIKLYIKEVFLMVRKKDKVFILLIILLIMMAISKRINLRVKEKWLRLLLFMKVNGKWVRNMEKVFMII